MTNDELTPHKKKAIATVPGVIKSIRDRLGVTQSELAKRIHVTLPSVYRYESGKSAPNSAALKHLYESRCSWATRKECTFSVASKRRVRGWYREPNNLDQYI